MSTEETIGNLITIWCNALEKGNDLPVEELCIQHPELACEVAARVDSLRAMQWLNKLPSQGDDMDCSFPRDVSELALHKENEHLPQTSLSVDELIDSITASGLRSTENCKAARNSSHEDRPRDFVRHLINEKLLTQYQARVFLSGSDQPIVLDEYEVLEPIGEGGMGVVYRALHRTMNRIVAVKILPSEMVNSRKLLRFHQEIKASAKLQHPNIVTTFDARQSDGIHFLVMEYIDGKNLAEVVQAQGKLNVSRTVNLILQAARGLLYAHSMEIIHRDIKPENLILNSSGVLKILDLGLARIRPITPEIHGAPHINLTEAGIVMGTVNYMPPEQAEDSKAADHRSDIYSLGCTLFYLLTESPVYSGNSPIKIAMAHQQSSIPSLRQYRNDVTEELDQIYAKMLAKCPDDRFQSLSEVIDALESLKIDDWDSLSHFEQTEDEQQGVATRPPEKTNPVQPRSSNLPLGNPRIKRWTAKIPTKGVIFFLILAGCIFSGFVLNLITRWGILHTEYQRPLEPEDKSTANLIDPIRSETTNDTGSDQSEKNDKQSQLQKNDDLESDIARWVLEQGGVIRVELVDARNFVVSSPAMLPPGPLLIRQIRLDSTEASVTDKDIQRLRALKGLKLLNLNFQNVSESSIDVISDLPPLENLSLFQSQLTDDGLKRIVAAHPNLINLGIGQSQVTEAGLSEILKLRQLRELYINSLPLKNSNIKQLKSLASLYLVNVSWTSFDDEGLDELSKWSNLKQLEITGTNVTAEGVRRFRVQRPDCVLVINN